jgi:hypothetical protein
MQDDKRHQVFLSSHCDNVSTDMLGFDTWILSSQVLLPKVTLSLGDITRKRK